jgi:hypothetical protein
MTYKTFTEQVLEHVAFLQGRQFDIDELKVDSAFVRCRAIGQVAGRGELSYKTTSGKLNNGLFGLATWFRGVEGESGDFKTYGLGPDGSDVPVKPPPVFTAPLIEDTGSYEKAACKAFGFWKHSAITGKADYLDRKGVGYYGIRFRSNEHGNVAVVPMFDEDGYLWSYQLLNPDGSKRFPKDGRTEGLFHALGKLINGKAIGIAESYVTAATCMELAGIPTVCAFGCHNLKSVAMAMRKLYPESELIIFADNDRHLRDGNQGLLKAQGARDAVATKVGVVVPDFGDLVPSKEASDWNDLLRLKGREAARAQLRAQYRGLLA